MKIKTTNYEAPIIMQLGRSEYFGSIQRQIAEIWTEEPLPSELVAEIADGWSIVEYDNSEIPQLGYDEVIRYSTWIAQTDANIAVVLEKEATIATLNEEKMALAAEKEEAVQAKETLQTATIPTLLRGRTDDVLVELLDYIPEWTEGVYVIGDVRKYEDQPKICCQAHDSTGNPAHNPTVASLWSPYHAKSAEYALPWIAPTGAQDIYKKGEYMVYTDGETYECLSDTNYSPDDYAQAWQAV